MHPKIFPDWRSGSSIRVTLLQEVLISNPVSPKKKKKKMSIKEMHILEKCK
jgi:hypothetical protein